MGEQKEPQEMKLEKMDLGELIVDLIKTERKIVKLEYDLNPFVLDEFWRNSPYPENRESSVRKMQEQYRSYQTRFDELVKELNRKEQRYLRQPRG